MMKVIEHVHIHINTLQTHTFFYELSYNNLEIKFVIDFICLFECAKRASLISNRWFKENWCNGDVAIYIVYTEIDICFHIYIIFLTKRKIHLKLRVFDRTNNPFIIKGCTAIIFLKHIHMRCILIKKTCLISKYLSPMSPMPGEMRLNFWKGENNHFVLTKLGIVSINQTTKLHKLNWHFKTVKKCSNKVSIQIYFYLYYILYLTRWTWMKKVLYFFYIVIQIILNTSK